MGLHCLPRFQKKKKKKKERWPQVGYQNCKGDDDEIYEALDFTDLSGIF